jgi:hypothetical protein
MAFAAYTDVEARWRTLTAAEQAKATVLLDDASNVLSALVTVDATDEQQAKILKQVCCSMVIRSMVAGASGAFGVDELQATMGPIGQTAHFANPNGDMYLTKFERKLLGIGGGKGRILYPSYGPLCGNTPEVIVVDELGDSDD